MSVRREDRASKGDELQSGCSWIPVTPAKPGSAICTTWEEHEKVEANWVVLNNASGGINNWPPHISNSPVYEENLISFESWVAGQAAAQWKNISFGNLLKAAMEKPLTHTDLATSSASCCLHPQFEGTLLQEPRGQTDFIDTTMVPNPQAGNSHLTISSGSSLLQDQCAVTDRSSIHSRQLFNHDAMTRTITDADSKKNAPFQFQPVTPQKIIRSGFQEYAVKHSNTDNKAPKVEKNEIPSDGVMLQDENKKKSHLIDDQLCEVTSAQLQENHKPDKGEMEEADLVKTPQQKTRRKKHRPKVIIEGQKKIPKSSAKKDNSSQETTRVKRKYVRRNGVTSPLGGGTNGTDSNKKTPSATETPVGKRRYRTRGSSKSEGTDKEITETAEIMVPRYTRRSCRRSLNFNTNGPVRDETFSNPPSSDCGRELQENLNEKVQPEAANSTRETEVMKEKEDVVTSHVCTRPTNQLQEDIQSKAEQHPQSSLAPINKEILNENNMLADQPMCAREKCQIVFSDVTHDREASYVQVSMNPDGQGMPKTPSGSMDRGKCSAPEKQIRGLKRQNTDKTVETALCSTNETRILDNSLQACDSVFTQNDNNGTPGLHFPVIFKKKRTEKVYNTATSSMQMHIIAHSNNDVKLEHDLRYSCKNLVRSPPNQGSCGAQNQVTNLLLTKDATYGTQSGRQAFEDLLALGPTQRIKRRRTKGPNRQRNSASVLESCKTRSKSQGRAATISLTPHKIENFNKPLRCIEALVADTHSTMATKKRSKRSMPINSTVQNVYHQNFAGTSMGLPLALTWISTSPVDFIIDKLNRLDLNTENRESEANYNAFMRYQNYYEEHHALVPFQNSGAVIPFNQVRRRKPRPKVDLDDETTRVWRLLLENINSEGIDGTNEENTKWWEDERRVFIGRAESFIARMHLVQGDRHFSPWKGSVVDSVVGVFLTQNVSDHLSSSAFMSLAARFPAKQKIHLADFHDEKLSGELKEPEICELQSDETLGLTEEILNEAVCGEDTKMHQKFKDDSMSEVNSMKIMQNASGNDSILEDSLRGQSINTSPGPVISREIIGNRSVSSNENGKDTEDTLSSKAPETSSQNSADSPITLNAKKSDSCLLSTSDEEQVARVKPSWVNSSTSFVKLLQMTGNVLHGIHGQGNEKTKSEKRHYAPSESLAYDLQKGDHLGSPTVPTKTIASGSKSSPCHVANLEPPSTELELFKKNSKFFDSFSEKKLSTTEISELSSESASGTSQKSTAISFSVQKGPSSIARSSNNEQILINQKKVDNQRGQTPEHKKIQGVPEKLIYQQNLMDATGSSNNIDNSKNSEHNQVNSNKNDLNDHPETKANGPKSKGERISKETENPVNWDQLRKQTQLGSRKRERTSRTLDSVDWDAIRCADVNEIAQTIKDRGMNNVLAERIKDFLNRIVRDHGSIDLEWLRDVPPDKAKEYLLSIRGLGLKSVECVRLLTLHHLAFPVDTNVGRIAVRLGWVPLQPLPESLQLHLLELYPVLESIQKYLWPRLCKLDQKTLYELHYQMITFGKVFCTKSKPNCNACPMRGECRHFASAYASARLALPAPQDKSIMTATENRQAGQNPIKSMGTLQLPSPQTDEMGPNSGVSNNLPIIQEPHTPEPIIEVPATPEPDYTAPECDIESAFGEDPDEIPTIHLNMAEFTHNLQTIMQQNMELQEGDMSKALVALTSEAASIPLPKLKNVSQLRTEHQVYELPDSHQLLEGMDKREPDDPCPYLLAIWTPGETMDSIEAPEKKCSSQGHERLCSDETCSSCNSIRESKSQTVRGTLLIPCRTAMRGSFPLNGTYFQVNEVFSDHESSLSPMDIPREWLWNLPRRTVYFGTSIPTIFKGLSTEGIQYCFWRGFVCVRGFDRKTRAPRPLVARLHFPASKLGRGKGKIDENI